MSLSFICLLEEVKDYGELNNGPQGEDDILNEVLVFKVSSFHQSYDDTGSHGDGQAYVEDEKEWAYLNEPCGEDQQKGEPEVEAEIP